MDGTTQETDRQQETEVSAASRREMPVGAPAGPFDIARIMRAIPHRYPMLMIDRVTDVILHQSAVGV
jgi:3-hydroxyacyl-[acyl-carrier-protein] dehydratase